MSEPFNSVEEFVEVLDRTFTMMSEDPAPSFARLTFRSATSFLMSNWSSTCAPATRTVRT
jgi:hypothetical protein